MKDLLEIREQINNIDDQLVELWKERMALSLKVAEYKKENRLPILDEQREKELLERIGGLAGTCCGCGYSASVPRIALRIIFALYSPRTENISLPVTSTPQLFTCSSITGSSSSTI
jgi:hypothetical protein